MKPVGGARALFLLLGVFLALWPGDLFAQDGGDRLASLQRRFLDPETSARDRVWLARNIATVGTAEAQRFLLEHLFEQRSAAVRRAAFEGAARGPEPIPAGVLRRAVEDSDPLVRTRSLELLADVDPAAALARSEDAFLADPDPRFRRAAAAVLARSGDEEAARLILTARAELTGPERLAVVRGLLGRPRLLIERVLGDRAENWEKAERDPDFAVLPALVLAARAEAEFEDRLEKLARSDDPRVQAAAATGLDRIAHRRAPSRKRWSRLRRVASRHRDLVQQGSVLEAVEVIGHFDPELGEWLVAQCGHRDWRVRAAAAEALRGAAASAAATTLAGLLEREKVWQARVAMAHALARSGEALAVPALIDALEGSSGREAQEVAQSLTQLTGEHLGRQAGDWRRWWADHAEQFRPAALDGAFRELDPAPGGTGFYGLEVASERVCFVVDVSGSMEGAKLAILRRELAQVVEALDRETRFNMVLIGSAVRAWQRGLVAMTETRKRAALDHVDGLTASGRTNLWEALRLALEDEEVDTIYLLSDGKPTTGEIISMPTIVARIRELNRHRRVAFHVVLIDYHSRRLRELALESGGSYTQWDA